MAVRRETGQTGGGQGQRQKDCEFKAIYGDSYLKLKVLKEVEPSHSGRVLSWERKD